MSEPQPNDTSPTEGNRQFSYAKYAPDKNLNLNVRGMQPSATVAINEHSDRLRREGRSIFKLGLGQSPFPVPESVAEALRRNAHQKDYLPVNGLPELRETVANYHCKTFGIETEPDNVLVGPGSKELMFILQVVFYGDLVIPTPTWVSYAPQAHIVGRHVRWLPTTAESDWQVTPQQIHDLCKSDPNRPRILILNYPGNPTGLTTSPERLEELAEVARRYGIVLLSDEIYGKLDHHGTHRSIVPMYPEGSIFSSGLSKWCGAGGWRLGVFVFPESLSWLRDAMAAVASETYTSTSAPIQYAAITAFREGPYLDRYTDKCRRVLKVLGRETSVRLLSAGVDVKRPDGAFYLFPDFGPREEVLRNKGISTSAELCDRLLEETGVAILPGSVFGRPEGEFTARLAYVNFDGEAAVNDLDEGVDPDQAFLESHCGEVFQAIDRICEWVN